MKIRLGFVTNSSSSSYVVIMKKDDYAELVNDLHPIFQRIAEMEIGNTSERKLGGEDVVVLYGTVYTDDMGQSIDTLDIPFVLKPYNKKPKRKSEREIFDGLQMEGAEHWRRYEWVQQALDYFLEKVELNGGVVCHGE